MDKKINIEDFDKVEMRVGTIVEVGVNKKARKPTYKVKIDFGEEIGIKTSSAQITDLYKEEDLVGKQVICCVNLAPMHIVEHLLGAFCPDLIVARVPKEPDTDDNVAFQRQSFLGLHICVLKPSAATKSHYRVTRFYSM